MLNLNDLFTYTDETHALTQDQEVEEIRAAQAGDESATERLLLAYGRTLRAAISEFKGGVYDGQLSSGAAEYGTPSFAHEDVRQAALEGALEAIREHDPEKNPRLAGRLRVRVARALSDEAATRSAFQIPDRTLSRFFGIMELADGDLDEALRIAPEKNMKPETLLTVYAATGSETLPSQDEEDSEAAPRVAGSLYDDGSEVFADVEDQILVESAFQAVDDEEARIVELRYGFRATEDYAHGEEIPDGEIAKIVGLTRPTVQRRRGVALEKMRKALGALEESDWKE